MSELARAVVIEQPRNGRRPRYHSGAISDAGNLLTPEGCNLDQCARRRELAVLDELPPLRRPWSQLCGRCYRGDPRLIAP